MAPDAVSAWPSTYPIGRTLIAFLIIPPLMIGPMFAAGMNKLTVHELAFLPIVTLMYSWPGYVIFAGLGIPILLFFFRFKLARFWEFAVVGMICTEIPWLVIAFTSGGDAATVRAQLRGTLPIFAPIGIGSGIITRLIVLGMRKPL